MKTKNSAREGKTNDVFYPSRRPAAGESPEAFASWAAEEAEALGFLRSAAMLRVWIEKGENNLLGKFAGVITPTATPENIRRGYIGVSTEGSRPNFANGDRGLRIEEKSYRKKNSQTTRNYMPQQNEAAEITPTFDQIKSAARAFEAGKLPKTADHGAKSVDVAAVERLSFSQKPAVGLTPDQAQALRAMLAARK